MNININDLISFYYSLKCYFILNKLINEPIYTLLLYRTHQLNKDFEKNLLNILKFKLVMDKINVNSF